MDSVSLFCFFFSDFELGRNTRKKILEGLERWAGEGFDLGLR